MVFKVHMCKSFQRKALDGWTHSFAFLLLYVPHTYILYMHTHKPGISLSPSLSLILPLSYPTVRCVNTGHASSKAFRLARLQANYVQDYLENAVVRTVAPAQLK